LIHDHFQEAARDYEQDEKRVRNVKNIAQAILNEIDFEPVRHIVDFGAGTGLLLGQIASHVDKITAIDVSPAMIQELKAKADALPCELEILTLDLTTASTDRKFDGVISSMTMHHIEDIPSILRTFYDILDDGGFIALADLDLEDGTFHSNDTGVFHLGFNRDQFLNDARNAGFKDLLIQSVSVSQKPQGDYPIFLLTGLK